MTRNVFWDLDGTLIYSLHGVQMSMNYVCEKLKIDRFDTEIVSKMVGPSIEWSLKELCGFEGEMIIKGRNLFYEHYYVTGWKNSTVYPNVHDCLKLVKRLGGNNYIATMKPHEMTPPIPEYFGMKDELSGIFGAINEQEHKKDVLGRAIEENPCENAVMIGDVSSDIVAGKECGILTAGVLYGFGDEEGILAQKPTYIAKRTEDLQGVIETFFGENK